MVRRILELRVVFAMAAALVVGAWGVHGHPLDPANVYLQIVELSHPTAFLVIVYAYATLWFTTPFLGASVLGSLLTIVVYRHEPRVRQRPLPPYRELESCPAQMLRWPPRGYSASRRRRFHVSG